MFTVYILKSGKDDKYHIGCTNSLNRRFKEHTEGRVKSTKHRRPMSLVFREEFETNMQARRRELEIKSMKGGNKFKQLIKSAAVVQG